MGDSVLAIARSGLEVERKRVEVIASNIANAGTPISPEGQGYASLTLVSAPRSTGAFSELLASRNDGKPPAAAMGVQVQAIVASPAAPRLKHEPTHPLADSNGNVAYPNVEPSQQMTLLVQTQRAYEANLVMYNAARSMYSKALQIGGRK